MKIDICITHDYRILSDDFDRSDWSGYNEDEYFNHHASVYNGQYSTHIQQYDVEPNKTYYFVYAVYFDGGTFGRTLGYTHKIGLFEDVDIANQVADCVRKNIPTSIDCDWSRDDHYSPWYGYFAGLQDVKIDRIYT